MGKDSMLLRKLLAATAVAALAVAATAIAAASHATGTFTGRTSQRLAIKLDVGPQAVRSGHVNVKVTCVRKGHRRVVPDAADLARDIPINADGTFGARQHSKTSDFELRIAGQITGRRVSGRYSEQFTGRFGACRSGRVTFRAER